MKKPALAALLSLLATLPLAAQETPTPASSEKQRAARERIRPYDKDGDGKLSDEEKAAAKNYMRERGEQPERRKQMLKRFDKDGDGKLSDAERIEMEKAREQFGANREKRQAEILKRFDKDGDGQLNDAERAEAEKAREEMQKKRRGKERGA